MRLSEKITDAMIAHSIVKADDREIYQYGFELLLADAVSFAALLVIGALARQLWYSAIYLFCFVLLRSFAGGYHAKTHLRCQLCMTAAFLVFLFLNSRLTPAFLTAFVLGDIVSFMPVLFSAPLPHANRPLSEASRRRNRKRALLTFMVLAACSCALSALGRQEGVSISLTLWIVSACMIPAIIINRVRR